MILDEEPGAGSIGGLDGIEVSIVRLGDRLRSEGPAWLSFSFQSAGVGGTGPRLVTPAGGRRLFTGGDMIGTEFLSMDCTLCDLLDEGGGGPGGGGGRGMPGSHLD